MENLQQKESALWWKEKFIETALISLHLYKKTNDEQYYTHAEYFRGEADEKDREYRGILR